MTARSAPRTALTQDEIRTLSDVERAIAQLGQLQRDIDEIQRTFEQRVQALRADAVDRARARTNERDRLFNQLHAYARENRDDLLPRGKKSREFPSGTLGFRLGQPKVRLLKKAALILAKLKATDLKGLNLTDLIRTKEELDLKAVVRHRARLKELDLGDAIRVSQDEGFYISPTGLPVDLTANGVTERFRSD